MRLTPHRARIYILLAAFLLVLPSVAVLYKGQQGRFLLARADLASGRFQETVIYIAQHNFSGAVGYVINKPLDKRAVLLLPEHVQEQLVTDRIFWGGPVSYPEHVQTFTTEVKTNQFLGYAGWMPFQLEYELMKGGWIVVDAPQDVFFTPEPKSLWREMMKNSVRGSSLRESAIY